MSLPVIKKFECREGSTPKYRAQIVDEESNPVSIDIISNIYLTLYDLTSGQIINSRNRQNIKNTNDVTIDTSGNLVWSMRATDNPIISVNILSERHRALFEYSWNDGSVRTSYHEVDIIVRNLGKVPIS